MGVVDDEARRARMCSAEEFEELQADGDVRPGTQRIAVPVAGAQQLIRRRKRQMRLELVAAARRIRT